MRQHRRYQLFYAYISLVFIVLCVAVYFMYIKKQGNYLDSRGLRLVSSMCDNLSLKIRALQRPLQEITRKRVETFRDKKQTQAKGQPAGEPVQTKITLDDIKQERHFKQEVLRLEPPDFIPEPDASVVSSKDLITGLLQDLQTDLKKIKWVEAPDDRNFFVERLEKINDKALDRRLLTLSFDGLQPRITWETMIRVGDEEREDYYKISLELFVQKDDFFADLINKELFDHVLVFEVKEPEAKPAAAAAPNQESTSKEDLLLPLYQYHHNENRILGLQDLMLTEEENAWRASTTTAQSTVTKIMLANREYRLFSQPLNINTKIERGRTIETRTWVLVGLLEAENLARESWSFSVNWGLLLAGIILLAVFMLPILRLNYMGGGELMTTADIYRVYLSLFLICVLVTVGFIDFYVYKDVWNRIDGQLTSLAGSMKRNFREEMELLLHQMDVFDERQLEWNREHNADKRKEQLINIFENDELNLDVDSLCYPHFTSLAWTDAKGGQVLRWKTKSTETPLIDVGGRPYFQKIRNGTAWNWKPYFEEQQSGGACGDWLEKCKRTPDKGFEKFYIQPVYSWTTSKYEVIVSKRRKAPDNNSEKNSFAGVMTLTTKLPSMLDPVLPKGYGFAVIDRDGLVLYHSSSNRNLLENMYIECEDNARLRSAVESEIVKTFSTTYTGKGYRFHVSPLARNIPWTLITFHEKEMIRDLNLVFLTQVALWFVGYFLFLALIFFAVRISVPSLKGRNLLHRLRPREERMPVYRVLCVGYLFIIMLEIEHILMVTETYQPLPIFILGAATMIMTGYKMKEGIERNNALPLDITLLAAVLVLIRFFLSEGGVFDRLQRVVFIVLIYLLVLLLSRLPDWLARSKGFVARCFSLKRLYAMTYASFLTALVTLPVANLAKNAFDYEAGLFRKKSQLELLRAVKARDDLIAGQRILNKGDQGFNQVVDNSLGIYRHDPCSGDLIYSFDLYPNALFGSVLLENQDAAKINHQCRDTSEAGKDAQKGLDSRPGNEPLNDYMGISVFNNISSARHFFSANEGEARTFNWSRQGNCMVLREVEANIRGGDYTIHTPLPSFLFGDPEELNIFKIKSWRIVPWLALLVFCPIIFYFSTRIVAHNLFLLGLPEDSYFNRRDMMEILAGKRLGGNCLILGSDFQQDLVSADGSHCIIDLKKLLVENYSGNFEDVCNAIQASIPKEVSSIIVYNYSYTMSRLDPRDPGLEEMRFHVLEILLSYRPARINIFSKFDPAIFYGEHQGEKEAKAAAKGKKDEEPVEIGDADASAGLKTSVNWRRLQKSLRVISFVDDNLGLNEAKQWRSMEKAEKWQILQDEARYLQEMVDIVRMIREQDPNLEWSEERIIEEIKELARGYYYTLWLKCTKRERVVLYNLAENSFVNALNVPCIRYLAQKNLVETHPNLRLISRSFTAFVLEEFSEADRPPTEESNMVTWRYLKIPIGAALVSGVAFLSATQQDMFQILLAFLSTLSVGVLPNLANIAKMFGSHKGGHR